MQYARAGVIAVLIVVWSAATVMGGTISIRVSTDTKFVDGKPVMMATVKNTGDEPAANVRVTAELSDQKTTSKTWEQLKAGGEKTADIRFEKLPDKPGRYPVIITTEFADLNMYPFSAVNITALEVGNPGPAQVAAKLEETDDGLLLTMKNLNTRSKTVGVRMVHAKELTVKPPTGTVKLEPFGTGTFQTSVSNFSAMPGATYPVYAVMTYENDEEFSSLMTVKPYKVQGDKKHQWSKTGLIIAGAALLSAFIVLQVRAYVKKNKRKAA